MGAFKQREIEITERLNAVLEETTTMATEDIIDCVYGSVSFTMIDQEKEWLKEEINKTLGRE